MIRRALLAPVVTALLVCAVLLLMSMLFVGSSTARTATSSDEGAQTASTSGTTSPAVTPSPTASSEVSTSGTPSPSSDPSATPSSSPTPSGTPDAQPESPSPFEMVVSDARLISSSLPAWAGVVDGFIDGSLARVGVTVCGSDRWAYFDELVLAGPGDVLIMMPTSKPWNIWDLDPVLRVEVTAPGHSPNRWARPWTQLYPHDVSDEGCDDVPRFKQIIRDSWIAGWTRPVSPVWVGQRVRAPRARLTSTGDRAGLGYRCEWYTKSRSKDPAYAGGLVESWKGLRMTPPPSSRGLQLRSSCSLTKRGYLPLTRGFSHHRVRRSAPGQ